MAFPFSHCPYITRFTRDTAQQQWKLGEQRLYPVEELLIYHESAEVIYTTEETVLRAVPGSVLFLPKNIAIQANVTVSGSVICIGYSLQKQNHPSNLSLIMSSAPSQLRNRFLHFVAFGTDTPSVETECCMLSDFYAILYELQRNTTDGNRRAFQADKIRPSVAYLDKHFTDRHLKLGQIASLSGVSETYFRTLFVRQYGCTPLQYLIEKRIRQAERLLKETDLSISEIEAACGFQSHAYFLKQYSRITGISPKETRKN